MNYPRFFANALLLLTIPSMAAYPQAEIPSLSMHAQAANTEIDLVQKLAQNTLTYDDILTLLNQLETGELEQKCSDEDLDQINQFLASLAAEGMIPGDPNEEFLLACDIHTLLQDANPYEYAYSYGAHLFSVIPCKSWIHKRWDVTKKFVKKHKKAIIIGAVAAVVVTVIVLTAGAAAAAAPAAAGAVGTAKADSDDRAHSESDESSTPAPSSDTSGSSVAQDSPALRSAMNESISFLKNHAAKEHPFLNFFDPEHPLDFSIEENSRILGSVYAHRQVEEQAKTGGNTNAAHQAIDQKFSTDFKRYYTPVFALPQSDSKNTFSTDLYHLRGQRALDIGCYDQALSDLDRTLELNPHNPNAYLGRAKAHLGKGDYEHSVADYQKYTAQKPTPTSYAIDFSIGLSKGLPRGVYDSGEQFASFGYSVISHPIDTGTEVCEAFVLMGKLVGTQEWETIGKALSPEVHKLITEWDTLSPREQGEAAGYAIGKHGADIFLPCAAAKAISKCAAGTQEILAASRILKGAEHTLALETIARSGTSPEEVAAALKKLSGTERAVAGSGVLSAVGGTEGALAESAWNRSKEMFKKAEASLQSYRGQYLPEKQIRDLIHQAGIKTFPRPKGIPDNFKVKISKNGAGMKYVHPIHEETNIRVMPGKPHSPNPSQQKPYVIQIQDGKVIDKHGNQVLRDAPEAHIPVEEFIYRNN